MLSTGGPDCIRFVDPGSGYSALWIASAKGHLGIVKALVEATADVNWGNKNDATPLLVASQQGELEVVQALLGASAEVDKVNVDGATALSVASQAGHLDVVKALQHRARLTQRDFECLLSTVLCLRSKRRVHSTLDGDHNHQKCDCNSHVEHNISILIISKWVLHTPTQQ